MPGEPPGEFGEITMGTPLKHIAIVGGGPAGLRAAEVAATGEAHVTVYDAKASVGRKFLVAGKGGLNLTKAEPTERFLTNYRGPGLPGDLWNQIITDFDPEALRSWATGLGVETFAASTGRVYPREMKAAPLLRRWVQRLRAGGVDFAMHHRLTGLGAGELEFDKTIRVRADAIVLALGGASWPETGSDGRWLDIPGVATSPWQPANCGWEVAWPSALLAEAEGKPLKNIKARAGEAEGVGELLITQHGLEGGAIYQLGPALRSLRDPVLHLDLKPNVSEGKLVAKLGLIRRSFVAEAIPRWKLGEAAGALLRHFIREPDSAESLAKIAKNLPIPLLRPRPLDEAISSAGGVRWSELDETLMLKKLPGVFCAGEMIDWEAPTGGYLMQACFATGTHAGKKALAWTRMDKTRAG